MQVKYIHGRKGLYSGNIIWSPAVPMRGGKFPPTHPAAPGSEFGIGAGDSQLGTSAKMNAFRERGYWASCFPEGDGITLDNLNDKSPDDVAQDISEVFGWTVRVQRS
jgi:hypothetical protein